MIVVIPYLVIHALAFGKDLFHNIVIPKTCIFFHVCEGVMSHDMRPVILWNLFLNYVC